MKSIIRLMVVSMFMFLAAPAWSGEAVHVYHCQMDDAAHDDAIAMIAKKWLEAARELPGGENLKIAIHFPVAAMMADGDFLFVVTAPDFVEMGKFLNAYEDSTLEIIDDDFDALADCPDSTLWETLDIDE